jgi:hypothetical protein
LGFRVFSDYTQPPPTLGQAVVSSLITALLLPGIILLLWLLLPETFGPPIKEHWRLGLAVYLVILGTFGYRMIAQSTHLRIVFWAAALILVAVFLASFSAEFLERWWRSGLALIVAAVLFRAAIKSKSAPGGGGYGPFWIRHIAGWVAVVVALVFAFSENPREHRLSDAELREVAASYRMQFPFTLVAAGDKKKVPVPKEGYSDALCIAHDGYVFMKIDDSLCASQNGLAAEYYYRGGDLITRRVLTFADVRNPPYFDCVRFYKTGKGRRYSCPVILQVLHRE